MTAVLPLVLPLTYPTILRTASPDRATERRKWDFESGDYGPFASFARTGAGTAFTTAGMIQQFASNVPRITDKGLLLEGKATNLFTHSLGAGAFGNSSGLIFAANAEVAPDGSQSGTVIKQAGLDSNRYELVIAPYTFASAAPLLFTWFQKRKAFGGSGMNGVPGCLLAVTNAVNATIGTPYKIGDFFGGWDRWASLFTISDGSQLARHRAYFGGNGFVSNPIGIVDPFAYWGLNLQSTNTVASPIRTTGAAATRGAESAALIVPAGCTKWEAVYGDARIVANGSGLVPGASFDLVSASPWIGLGNELKNVRFAP